MMGRMSGMQYSALLICCLIGQRLFHTSQHYTVGLRKYILTDLSRNTANNLEQRGVNGC